MSQKPESDHSIKKPAEPIIPEPTGDGFPAEKDVSTPPVGTDQTSDQDDRDEKEP